VSELVHHVVDTLLNSNEFEHVLNASILLLLNFVWLVLIEIEIEVGPAECRLTAVHHVLFQIVITGVVLWCCYITITTPT
jgi:hypothetical protein